MTWWLLLAAFLVIAPWWLRGALQFLRDLDDYRAARTLRHATDGVVAPQRKTRRFLLWLRSEPATLEARQREERKMRMIALVMQAVGLVVAVAAFVVVAL
jgi:hypothetical protein